MAVSLNVGIVINRVFYCIDCDFKCHVLKAKMGAV